MEDDSVTVETVDDGVIEQSPLGPSSGSSPTSGESSYVDQSRLTLLIDLKEGVILVISTVFCSLSSDSRIGKWLVSYTRDRNSLYIMETIC